jgi:hypothetical protein
LRGGHVASHRVPNTAKQVRCPRGIEGKRIFRDWTADILEELEEEDDEDEDDDALNVRFPVMLGFVVTVGKYCVRACRTRERA